MIEDLKKLWDARSYLIWQEWIDGVAHAVKVPHSIQVRLCDWVDNTYYK